jgi:hypothetical protein
MNNRPLPLEAFEEAELAAKPAKVRITPDVKAELQLHCLRELENKQRSQNSTLTRQQIKQEFNKAIKIATEQVKRLSCLYRTGDLESFSGEHPIVLAFWNANILPSPADGNSDVILSVHDIKNLIDLSSKYLRLLECAYVQAMDDVHVMRSAISREFLADLATAWVAVSGRKPTANSSGGRPPNTPFVRFSEVIVRRGIGLEEPALPWKLCNFLRDNPSFKRVDIDRSHLLWRNPKVTAVR